MPVIPALSRSQVDPATGAKLDIVAATDSGQSVDVSWDPKFEAKTYCDFEWQPVKPPANPR